jgi:hypothetical protein
LSRTDAHRPYRARIGQTRKLIEVHDHRDGPCDLPTRKVWQAELKADTRAWRTHARYRCGWQLPPDDLAGLCGCPQCTQTHERREQRRRLRRSTPGAIREALREAETEAADPS